MAKKKNGKDPSKLTAKQQRFVEEVVVDWNFNKAAERAGYSARSAHNIGWQLMKQDKILDAIYGPGGVLEKQQERTRITADQALKEMAKIAFADIRNAFDEDGNLLSIRDMPEDVAKAVASFKVFTNPRKDEDVQEETLTKSIRCWDKTKALDQIGKHFNMFVERREHSGPDGEPIQHEHTVGLSPDAERLIEDLEGHNDQG